MSHLQGAHAIIDTPPHLSKRMFCYLKKNLLKIIALKDIFREQMWFNEMMCNQTWTSDFAKISIFFCDSKAKLRTGPMYITGCLTYFKKSSYK